MKVPEIIKIVEAEGWRHVKTTGSHRQFKHPTKPGRVTIPGRTGDDVAIGTLKSIYEQAQLKRL
jgi:predicted RNA binding protein YcfA (HicA-like mRNA interferase family)